MDDETPSAREISAALRKGRGGFAIDSWQSAQSMLFVAIMLMGGIAWGLKLEWRGDAQNIKIDALKVDVIAMEAKLDKGILPITLVELSTVKEKLVALHEELRGLQAAISSLQANQIVYRQNELLRQNEEQNMRRKPN